MVKKRIYKFILCILAINFVIFNTCFTVSAKEQMNFKNITIEDGLPQGTVQVLLQDRRGYIWIGTNDGLCRYNGYNFKIYREEEDKSKSLLSSYIFDIDEDNEGNIWVATSEGISKISSYDESITNYTMAEGNGNLSNSDINNIFTTKKGDILVATSDGLNIYDEYKDSFTRIFEGDALVSQYIYSITEDNEGNIWLGTTKGVNKINLETGETKAFLHDGEFDGASDRYVYKVYYDREGYIWVGTHNNGAARINLEDESIKTYTEEGNNLGGDMIKSFLRDSYGNMWVATNNGLSKLKADDDTFQTEISKEYDRNSLINNNIYSIIEDRTGLIWLGTYSGISIFNPSTNILHYKRDPFDDTTISNNMISALYEDDDGRLWIGSKKTGIDLLNRDTDKIININTNDYSDVIQSDVILDIEGHNEFIFISTIKGISIINKKDKTVKTYDERDGIPSNIVRCIYYDDLGYLWLGTTEGLAVLNLETDEILDITNVLEKYISGDRYIGDIIKDKDGQYWIGTFVQGGLLRINPKDNTAKVYKRDEENNESISSNSIRTLTEADDGSIWIGTSYGLNHFNKSTEEFRRYTTKDGLANNTIYGILIDNYGNPWCSTNMGISIVNLETDTVTNLDITDGLQSNEFNGNAYFKNKDGEFFFGGINGFNILNPENIEKNDKAVYTLTFDEFKVNGVDVENIDGRKFSHEENNIYIEVFLPNYKNSKGIQYYYILEGASSEWTEIQGNAVALTNLSPGKYKFKVKARDSNGIYSEISEISFEISPPFYSSKYAILIYIIIVILIVFNIKNKVKKLDRLVDKRTRELSDEMKRNNELFEKVIELEKNKNNYLINMSHELRTPLNVIYSTEQLIRELNKSDEGIEKNKLDNYMGILRNNTNRLLKIINDLIDTSKIEHGSYRIDIKEVDIVYVVEEAALSLRNYIEGKGINLIIDPEIEEKIIEADPNEIERCIVNIVSNAAKFTSSGGNIRVDIKELNDWVKIEITDDGIGIPKEYHKLIFNRFSQVVDKNAEAKGGSGLGLTITKKIIELHEGEIYVESEVGKGSKFVIILPIKQKKK